MISVCVPVNVCRTSLFGPPPFLYEKFILNHPSLISSVRSHSFSVCTDCLLYLTWCTNICYESSRECVCVLYLFQLWADHRGRVWRANPPAPYPPHPTKRSGALKTVSDLHVRTAFTLESHQSVTTQSLSMAGYPNQPSAVSFPLLSLVLSADWSLLM